MKLKHYQYIFAAALCFSLSYCSSTNEHYSQSDLSSKEKVNFGKYLNSVNSFNYKDPTDTCNTCQPTVAAPQIQRVEVAIAVPRNIASTPQKMNFKEDLNDCKYDLEAKRNICRNLAPKKTKKINGRYLASVAPSVKRSVFSKNGVKLNRYHFVRSCDTLASLAKKFLGSSSKSSELLSYNGSKFQTGALLYYPSPKNPDDAQMKSSFSDFPSSNEISYRVQAGEALSDIAYKKLGNYLSWRELAHQNPNQHPDRLKKGDVIKIKF